MSEDEEGPGGPVTQSFGLEDERAEEIVSSIEKSLTDDGKCLQEILQGIFEDDAIDEKEKMFSIYAVGFVGGRHMTINEICNIIGPDRFKYLLDGEGRDDDCMYR